MTDTIDEQTSADPPWLLLVYRIPREPTRLRAAVWRRIKTLGAVYLQNSVAALPDAPANERALRALRREIIDMNGTAQVLRCEVLGGPGELVSIYNAARDEEYEEILDKCQDFLAEIDKETTAQHFTYAELEENDEDLTKLRGWLDKVRARDTLDAHRRPDAEAALSRCAEALDGFANRVYQAEDSDG
ncbi:Chromate resistance protein ChrB [Nocardia nova]|uniref:Chromate resistance protein ChrB n=1 Tax=Nocardia nova TaxID=37330 RepID=UPI0037B5882A